MTQVAVRLEVAVAAMAAGCALLVARPLALQAVADPTGLLAALFVVLLVAGLLWPLDRSAAGAGANDAGRLTVAAGPTAVTALAVAAIGIGAFAAGRLVGWPGIAAVSTRFVLLNCLAAVAEEAFFRRFVYGVLSRHGQAMAVAGSSVLFAIVHVTVYGLWAMPIDLAAGVLLGWQRWATGSWRVPAVTHVAANLLMVLP